MIAVQLSFLPLGTEGISEAVQGVLDIIADSGLQYEIGGMSTVLSGNREELIGLVDRILAHAEKQSDFVLDIRFSNLCGL